MKIQKEEVTQFISEGAHEFDKFWTVISSHYFTKCQHKYVLKIIEWWGNIYTFKTSNSNIGLNDVIHSIEDFLKAVRGKEGKECGRCFKRNFLTPLSNKKINNNGTYKVGHTEIEYSAWGRPRQVFIPEEAWKAYKRKKKD